MRILADADIPHVEQSFGRLGDVRAAPAHELRPEAVRDADALLVRSVTRVDEALLGDSAVRFVGTATSGVDHVDLPYLRSRGIVFADAAGCNAKAVAEYVTAALLHLAIINRLELAGARLGIVGFGHVGRRVARYAAALGMECVVNDPPLARSTAEPIYRPLEEALACDAVTLHVPLEREGLDSTYHLANAEFLTMMKPGAVMINTSRGPVVDEAALSAALDAGRLGACVLDVWAHEPRVDPGLVDRCAIATPHIAGHSLDAKMEAVRRLYEALRDWLDLDTAWAPPASLEATRPDVLPLVGSGVSAVAAVAARATGISEYDGQMRGLAGLAEDERGRVFSELRSRPPVRREFGAWRVAAEGVDDETAATLEQLGFRVTREAAAARGAREGAE